jgi:tungstate transport system substrate-binding protein
MTPVLRNRPVRRATLLLAVLLSIVLEVALLPAVTSADDSSTLTIVGTSDVNDSNLVQSVLKPGFEAAFPQYTLNYVSQGTGAAITYAESGNASALLVHAASLENQFVAAGYSNEPFGRAIFWGDYILAGPTSDPADITTSDPHDVVGAFEQIATAGAANTADFVSRANTSGTSVQEHAIWALTTGVTTCTVSDANGGGASPSTTTGACPSPIVYPDWYHATGLTQGPNIVNADACNYPGRSGACYVMTDRGTFNFLESTSAISNLKIVTRDNDAAAPGGPDLLVNSFHAYAVNPAKFAATPAVQLNTVAATAFLNWVTSPAGQAAVGAYLSSSGDPPFLPDAAPALTSSGLPALVRGGETFTVTGSVNNVVPGTPALDGVRVSLQRVIGTGPTASRTAVASALTNSAGRYSITYTPPRTQSYYVSVPTISKIENASLTPVFGDLLAPAAKSVGHSGVQGFPHKIKVKKHSDGILKLKGLLSPTVIGSNAHLSLYVVHPKNLTTNGFHFVAMRQLTAGDTHFKKKFNLRKGHWIYELRYVNSGVIVSGFSHRRKVDGL